jgi:hypothetical protein
MNIFRRPDYKSEVTQFITQLKAEKPALESGQREGRALLWDKAIDRSAVKAYGEARVPQKPYVYQTSGK